MSNKQRYENIFKKVFGVELNQLNDSFTFQSIEKWDSLTHLTLIAELEEEFTIILTTEDILHFGSYINGIKILQKHGVKFEE